MKQLAVPPSGRTYEPQQWPAGQDIRKGAVNDTHTLVTTNNCQSTQQEGNHIWYWKQLPWASEVIDLRKDSITSTLLDQHSS